MSHSFGAQMRKQREQRDIALATIAGKTKIKQSLLEAMERDDLSQWPNGFFRRAFIRAYAEAIGLEADDVVRDFLTFHSEPAEVTSAISSLSFDNPRTSEAPPTRLRQIVGSAVTRLRSTGHRAATVNDDGAASAAPSRSPRSRAAPTDASHVPVGDLLALANLCTKLGQARRTNDLSPLLQEAARILDAWAARTEAHRRPDGPLDRLVRAAFSSRFRRWTLTAADSSPGPVPFTKPSVSTLLHASSIDANDVFTPLSVSPMRLC